MAAILNRGVEIAAKHRSIVTWRSGSLTTTRSDISFTGDGDDADAGLEVSKSEVSDVYITNEPVMNRSDKLGFALLTASLLCGAVGIVTSGNTAFTLIAAELGVAAVAAMCLAAGEREEIPVININTETDTHRFIARHSRDADVFCDTATGRP